MTDPTFEQALYGGHGPGGYRFLARSPGFLDDWLPEAERLCTGFGERPAGVVCPHAVFAKPFGPRHVAVVQVADQGRDDAGRPGALAFHLLVLTRTVYEALGADPFAIADRVPPSWQARDYLPTLTWDGGPLPPRTVEQVQQVLRRTGGETLPVRTEDYDDDEEVPHVRRGGSHVLLGGAQILVDGGRLAFVRAAPDPELLRALWTLLPLRTRVRLWPASFAFGNRLRFDVLAAPRVDHDDFAGYRSEEEAADYPEGRYEYAVQEAAERGDQRALDALFERRSGGDVLRLALLLLAVVGVAMAALRWMPGAKPDAAPAPVAVVPELPPPERFRTLTPDELRRMTDALRELAQKLDLPARPDAGAEELLAALDTKLGTPDPARDPGPLARHGPPQRQLRVLLWKHDLAAYRERGLNPVELVERLEQKVVRKAAP